jgi:hypothetical protein
MWVSEFAYSGGDLVSGRILSIPILVLMDVFDATFALLPIVSTRFDSFDFGANSFLPIKKLNFHFGHCKFSFSIGYYRLFDELNI